ncbi:sigma-70 family RNA polymerase sigma factor [Desulfosporosinus sp. SYSU MS00001]|uniref:sigma-70 family RNA polymerase sigma factor n=1 Tax=Desulfosporosinus sp. SYSU MS00001 TaxID=3416284 RepID=UPI003CE9A242
MKIDETNFIVLLKKREEKALDYLICNYGWLIKSIVKKNLYGLKNLQGECINDILLAVWLHIEDFDEKKKPFKNWLGAVSTYKCIDYKRKYLRELEIENIEDLSLASSAYVDRELLKNELDEDVEQLLNHLKSEDKKLFIDHFVQEKDIKALSEEMNLKPSVIYNRLSRAKNKLRGFMKTNQESRGIQHE